jgi:hypothetical protein
VITPIRISKKSSYLSPTSGVLGRAPSYQLRIVVLDQIFIKTHVLIFSENGVVVLNFILLEKGLISRAKQLANPHLKRG